MMEGVERYWAVLAAVFAILLILLAYYFIRKQRRLTARMIQMLDEAIAGRFKDNELDETAASTIESAMWRYLCDKETHSERLEAEKEQREKQISDISHQAVIPISTISLYAQLLEEELDAIPAKQRDEMAEKIEIIRQQTERLDFLMASLTKMSRIESGMLHLNCKRQSFRAVADTVKDQYLIRAEEKGICFEVEDIDASAFFDRKWTVEAVANIVDNAIKYTKPGGKVTVSGESLSSFLRVDITDTGIGIAEEEQAGIFGRFYRSREVSDQPGVGIGLYLAREVMKAQNGYIRLKSEIGCGSTFSLYFLKDEISQ